MTGDGSASRLYFVGEQELDENPIAARAGLICCLALWLNGDSVDSACSLMQRTCSISGRPSTTPWSCRRHGLMDAGRSTPGAT